MGAGKLDFLIEQGSTFQRIITIKDSALAPVNLTGWTITGKIRPDPTSATVLETFNVTLANQATSPGQFTVLLSATETSAIAVNAALAARAEPTPYYYDIEALKADGTTDRVLQGRALISPEVTR